jgi:ketosteroid isomerase-like protein
LTRHPPSTTPPRHLGIYTRQPRRDTRRAMSQENVDKIRAALDAFNRRDKTGFVEACHPELRNVPPRDWPEFEVVEGPEAVWDWFVENNEPWEESPLEYAEMIDAGNDMLAAELRGEMRGTASGADVHWSFWQVAAFRAGKVVHLAWFSDRGEALAAVRLSE